MEPGWSAVNQGSLENGSVSIAKLRRPTMSRGVGSNPAETWKRDENVEAGRSGDGWKRVGGSSVEDVRSTREVGGSVVRSIV